MSTIDNIRQQVVTHLLERHYRPKERGDDFFFKVEITDYSTLPYLFQSEVNRGTLLQVFCYGKWRNSPIIYLIITEAKQLYVIGEFEADYHEEVSQAARNIYEYSDQIARTNPDEVRLIHGHNLDGAVSWSIRINKFNLLADKLNYVFDVIKPNIDKSIASIRNSKYSYYFFNRQQFEEYLKTEPYYKPPIRSIKKNLGLKMLRVQNYRGIYQTVIDNLPEKTRWIVLTGENGFGKTSVLQAIAAGLYGNFDESGTLLVPETAFIGVEYYANGAIVENNSRASRQESADKKLDRELATYGSSRLQISASVTREMLDEQRPTTYHLFNSDGLLLSVEQLLKESNSYNKPFFDQLTTLFKTLIPQLADIRIELVNKLPEVLYVEQDEAGHILTKGVSFGQLAAGFRSIIAMIGDLVYRLSIRQDVENLRDLQGIVLIDELELHLHPNYQKLLPEVLTTQFPNIQFIISTHSPIPLLGIPKDAGVVLLHVSRSEETGIIIERLDVDFSVLTPNAILSSPIFGFKDLIPDSKADDQMIQPEDTYQEVLADQQLRQNINQFLSPERQQELLNLINQ